MYGESAIKTNKHLELIIELLPPEMNVVESERRIRLSERKTNVLEVGIPTISLVVAPSRNLAVLVEAAVRDYLLTKSGYSADKDLTERTQKAIDTV